MHGKYRNVSLTDNSEIEIIGKMRASNTSDSGIPKLMHIITLNASCFT